MENTFYQEPLPRTLMQRLFPRSFAEIEYPEWTRDVITVHTTVRLGWKDWARLLVSRSLMVESKTAIDVLTGHSTSASALSVLPPRSLTKSER